jgi:UDPglucose 6-dehydrogenase
MQSDRTRPDSIQRVSVFGLGKLGAVVAGCHASQGFDVIGVDVNADSVARVAACEAPIPEPGIEELYVASRGRLSATQDGEAAVRATDCTMLVVPTPSLPDGSYDVAFAVAACESIGRALRDLDRWHLVVMKSTVLPGICDRELIPALERTSGRRVGEGFGFCYNPEFIALGNIIHNIFYPDLALIGESDETAGRLLSGIYGRLLKREAPISRMNVVNAELTKIAVNTYVTTKISFANSLARICERLPGASVDVVTEALGRDTRIGGKYLRGGLGYAGPCFPRDNQALLSLGRDLGVPFHIAEATDASNLAPALRVVEMVKQRFEPGSRVSVLGLSYKPDTPVVERSQGVLIAQLLIEAGYELTVYDPMAMDGARGVLQDGVKYAESSQAALESGDVALLTTPWRQFEALEFEPGGTRVVIDCWGILSPRPGLEVLRLGVGPALERDRR